MKQQPKIVKRDLSKWLQIQCGLLQKDAQMYVEIILETIAENLKSGNTVQIRGFGTFETRMRKQSTAQNILGYKTMFVPAHRVVKFTSHIRGVR